MTYKDLQDFIKHLDEKGLPKKAQSLPKLSRGRGKICNTAAGNDKGKETHIKELVSGRWAEYGIE